MLRVLGVAAYPLTAAATRYRLVQLIEPLAARGVQLEVVTFLDDATFATLYDRSAWPSTTRGLLRGTARLCTVPWRARSTDVLLVQREAALVGPPVVELAARAIGRVPLVLDLDDATYIGHTSPIYGRVARLLRSPGKADTLIRRAAVVTCGGTVLADYARSLGARTAIIPTVVDTDRFRPRTDDRLHRMPVVGWVGSHSTFPWLEALLPALAQVALRRPFHLRVIGSGRDSFTVGELHVDCVPWTLGGEVAEFQQLDVGLYPMADTPWTAGKSALKSVQYMAVGVPFVASPVGAAVEVGEAEVTHLTATSPQEWQDALERLLADPGLRARLGAAGREHAVRRYHVSIVADRLAAVVSEAAASRGQPPRGASGGTSAGR